MSERPPNFVAWFWGISVISAVIAVGLVWLLIKRPLGDSDYQSFTLLILVPGVHGIMVGAASVVARLSGSQAMQAYVLSAVLLCVSAMTFMLEGAICMMMAAPIWLTFGVLGLWLGRVLAELRNGIGVLMCVAPLALVAGVLRDVSRPPISQVETKRVQTAVRIAAPPHVVWPLLLNLEQLPEPSEWYFRAGVAHPLGTRFDGETRVCILSTGDMRERIVKNQINRSIEWVVLNTPPTMRELNPFGEIHPSHLTTTFRVAAGGFSIQHLPNGETELVGWTTYSSSLEPDIYWDIWNRAIVRGVQQMVMATIRERAESATRRAEQSQ